MNPLVPTPLDVVIILVSATGLLAVTVGFITLLWLILVPKRRKQLSRILFRSPRGSVAGLA
ncbi:hypothetical protein [Leifsonia sp. NPDC058230]|uniref:hypothetical protein n=1 Tax=Leifsonia sp. NPDC058230 TaxID=3346391 RepID=UPI0036DE7901